MVCLSGRGYHCLPPVQPVPLLGELLLGEEAVEGVKKAVVSVIFVGWSGGFVELF